MTKISIIRCEEYSLPVLIEIFSRSFENIGIDSGVLKGLRVGLKPNLLTATAPDRAVITHPVFFQAAARFVRQNGGIPVMIESPAFMPVARVMKKGGYDTIVQEEGIKVADTSISRVIKYPGAKQYKRFEIIAECHDVDVFFNLPKLKTHALTYMTGAVKNFFGLIPGLNKSEFHIKAGSKAEFSDMLLDLYGAILHGFEKPKPVYNIMDAIIGMEGNGPGPGGKPVAINTVIAGEDSIAVDYIAATILGLDPSEILTITLGQERGLGEASIEKIEVEGNSVGQSALENFRPTPVKPDSGISRFLSSRKIVRRHFIARPVSGSACTLCYQCKGVCPAGAIGPAALNQDVPQFDYSRCIRCYCCLEICPEAAIKIEKGIIQKIFHN